MYVCVYTCTHVQEADCSQNLGYETLGIQKYSWDHHLEGKRRRQESGEGDFRLQCRPNDRDPVGNAGIRMTSGVVPVWAEASRSLCPHLIVSFDFEPPRKGYDLAWGSSLQLEQSLTWLTAEGCVLSALSERGCKSFSARIHLSICPSVHPSSHLSIYVSVNLECGWVCACARVCKFKNSNIDPSIVDST